MALYRYGDRRPQISPEAWIADSARIIGDVQIADRCYVGHGAVLRGDYGTICLGPGTAVEENATVHVHPEAISVIGERVTIGHGAVVHSIAIGDFCVIGMGAVLGLSAELGNWVIVAEGCALASGTRVPDEKIVAGVPGKVIRDVEERHKQFWGLGKELYVDLAARNAELYERID